MKLVALTMAGFVLVACAADGEVKVNASSNSDTKTSAGGEVSASEPPTQAPRSESSETTEGSKTLGAPAEQPAQPAAAACPLVCYVANKGRVAPADEQRLQGELASELTQLRGCGSANARPSLTLRFDSNAKLTRFGVDAERGNEGACVNTLRERQPNVTYQGPATLRCSEKCAGEPTRNTRRRGPR